MSLLFFDGFQDSNVVPKPEWLASMSSTPATGRDGTPNSACRGGSPTMTLPTPATTCFVGLARMATSRPDSPVLYFHRSGTLELVLTQNSGGMLELRRTSVSGTLLATSSGHAPIPLTNQWHHFQVKVALRSDGAGVCEVRLNGVTVINYTGQTAGVTGDVTQIQLPSATGGSGDLLYDDMWVCDGVDGTATQGAPNNSFLGDLKVATMLPTAAGDTTQFTPSTGVTNWSLVDENPANTTDYVSTSVSGNRDLYQFSDLPANALAPVAVRVGLYAQKSDAGVSSIKPVIKENGVVTAGATSPLLTTWAGYWGSLRTKKPSNDTPWTVADVNGLQAGVELA
jgi:hypothetical protein